MVAQAMVSVKLLEMVAFGNADATKDGTAKTAISLLNKCVTMVVTTTRVRKDGNSVIKTKAFLCVIQNVYILIKNCG